VRDSFFTRMRRKEFLRCDAQRFFSELFPGVVGVHPSSLHRRVRRLSGALRSRLGARSWQNSLETLIVDSTLLEVLHHCSDLAVGWGLGGSVGEVGIVGRLRSVKLHLICSPNRVPISYELTPSPQRVLPRRITSLWGAGGGANG